MIFTKWGEILSGGTLTYPRNIDYLFNFCVPRATVFEQQFIFAITVVIR